jgi:UMF1 family MFS transporter
MTSLLARLGLNRPELRAWAFYDWANSAYWTTIIAAVFPIYFARVAASGLPPDVAAFRYGIATTIALGFIAVVSPPLGALADAAGLKKRMLLGFMFVGALSTAALVFVRTGDWLLALLLFMVGNIGAAGSMTFYDSLLPHLARSDELDRVSTAGYAIGYIGGGLLLAINLLWIQRPGWFGFADAGQATRASFVSVAVWWIVFSLPLALRVPEPRVAGTERATLGGAFRRIGRTLGELRRYQHAFLMLLAFLIYNDGIQTIIRMASLYGTQVGIGEGSLIAALLLVQFVGIPCAFAFGRLAGVIGAKNAIFVSLVVYAGISILAFYMTQAWQFFALAILVGTVQGGSQGLSRSLFARLIPRDKSSEFFGFFGVFEKFAGIFGPLLFSVAVALTGSSRAAILSVILFFIVGALLLSKVDIEEGVRVADEENARAAKAFVAP